MTHLRIEQSTGSIEEVTLSIISKLYELVYAGLDASSNLQGRLHTPVSYRSEVQYLTTNFPNLYITSDDYAIPFEDPNMVTYLNSIGVGSNGYVTENDAANATIVANSANTTVTKFNELRYFTNITSSKNGWTGNSSGNVRFYEWTALEEVDISNFTTLGHNSTSAYEDTFGGCTSLKKVIASNKLTKIGHRAFRNCSNLELITGLSGEIEVFGTAFNSCTKLGDANFSNVQIYFNTNKSGDGGAFGSCTSLTTLLLSTNTTYLPASSFSGCNNLTTVSGLSNVTVVAGEAFKNCSKLATIDLDFSKLVTIGEQAFHTCTLLPIAELNCPSLTTLGGNAFMNCALLQTVTNLGNSITTLNGETFRGCTSLTSIVLPTTCTSLGNRVFYGCTSLISVDLSSITDLGLGVFYGCTLLSSLNRTTFSGITRLHAAVFKDCPALAGELSFPDVTELIFENGLRGEQFSGCTNLTKISLGHLANLTHAYTAITDAPFKNCTNLKIVDLGDSLTTLGGWNFNGCSNLKAIKLNITTPPSRHSLFANTTDLHIFFGNSNVDIYVPDAAVSTYLATAPFSSFADHIKPLSTYNEASILAS